MIETFNRLDRQVTHVELRPSQIRIFEQIDANADKRDLVVKLNTGGGKTTTGLIYLKHKMQASGEPSVYLVPTVQLARQVVDEGVRVGIQVSHWVAGDRYPPEDALEGKSIIVCTYEKFFNGRSTFARSDVRLTPGAIVLDDVHAGIESVRSCFGALLSREARADLLNLLAADLKTLEPANWTRIELDDASGLLEVPHWIYQSHISVIRSTLVKYVQDGDLGFAWGYLSQSLELCRLVFSGTEAYLSLDPPALEYVPHYMGARNRLFMSASIQDGAALVRELNCDPESAANPIDIPGEGSVGERMVVVPSLADPEFSRDQLAAVIASFVPHANVVILVSSFQAAEFWRSYGANVASKDTISQAVNYLRDAPRGQFWVFVQRYDGIDLPDAACRILVLDGLPQGERLIDRADSDLAGGVIGMRGKIANRVEQGLGRAVRSASDYCTVVLAGRDMANFISRRIVLENFSPLTVRQIEIGKNVSAAIAESDDKPRAVAETIRQCLARDEGWREYYASQIQLPPDNVDEVVGNASGNLQVANSERVAIRLAISRDYSTAASVMQAAANAMKGDKLRRAILKQAASRFLYMVDPVEAMAIQASAFYDNPSVSRPPIQQPKLARRVTSQSELISAWLDDFSDKNGALVALDQLRARLAYANNSKVVETAVVDLGLMLGADSSSPERLTNRGPDCLWVFDQLALCIEMKNEKSSKLSKDDAGQLQLSIQWVKQNSLAGLPIYPVIGTDILGADRREDFPADVVVMTQDGFIELLDRLRKMVVALISHGPLFCREPANIQKQLGPSQLLPAQIIQLGRPMK
jgi:hypothetical protein